MNSVFIDLEFCEIHKEFVDEREKSKFEIIEVGAVKLDEKNQVIQRFDALVKPQYGTISDFITELTHITNEMVAGAADFGTVMDSFLAWVGEDVTIYSWSSSDWRQLQMECRLKEYKSEQLEQLYNHWIDYQMIFGKILGIDQAVSLEKALLGAGIEFAGQKHSALADAENTAALYEIMQDEDQFKEKAEDILEWIMPTPKLTVNLGSLIPEDMLRNQKRRHRQNISYKKAQ